MQYTTTVVTQTPIVVTIGNFDGIHRGHQHLMHELGAMAQELHATPVLVTFSPHTLMVVRPNIHIYYLTTLEEKLTLAREYGGIADNIVIHFTPEVASMTATEFMDTLCSRFTIKGLVVGENFSLGHNRMGDISFLKEYGQEHGIAVQAIPLAEAEQLRISSTRIRALVSEGQVAEANELLGHPVTIGGVVRHGDHRGRLLGFPTANLLPETHKLLPANGVYVVRATVHEAAQRDGESPSTVYNGVANIGIRPTFNGKERLVEVHLLDTSLDLYDRYLTVDVLTRLRSEQRFSGIEALKAQIDSDAEQARQFLAHYGTVQYSPEN